MNDERGKVTVEEASTLLEVLGHTDKIWLYRQRTILSLLQRMWYLNLSLDHL